MMKKRHIVYTEAEVDTIRKHIAKTPKNGRVVNHGNGMAPIVARHGICSVRQKVAEMRGETTAPYLQDVVHGGTALTVRALVQDAVRSALLPEKLMFERQFWNHHGVWFILGMIFALGIALLV